MLLKNDRREKTNEQIHTDDKTGSVGDMYVFVLALTGCSKVSKENYDKIKIGMSYEEVVGVLGKPDTCEEPIMKTKSCMWVSSDKQIKIKFAADIVAWRSSEGI